ncbi:SMI1/KNR4 family protein [Nostoc flagelliforme]|uniref:SMI1/KNR4 family protein n=1 Tax=Nostoc flagelliforme TaxID=1306274 RepID=UPI000C2D2B60|nr:SMI1/KNR4 family protein [Nostoc flagelliforme]
MINNIQELRERLLTSGIVKNEQELQGCTSEEIAYIESKYGVLPRTYREILGLLGHSAGKLVNRSEFEFYFDQIIKMNEWQREIGLEFINKEEEYTPLPENTFCISARNGDPWFIIADGQDDCSVYFLHENGTIKESSKSVMDWIEGFVEEAEYWIRKGLRYSTW